MKKTFNVQYFERIRKNHIHALQPAYRKYILFPNDNAVTHCLIKGQYMNHITLILLVIT